MDADSIFDDQGLFDNRIYNLEGIADSVVASYPHGIAHGLQKDAIQNGWDAMQIPGKKPSRNHVEKNWSFRFILSKTPESAYMLQMIDEGTTGLTGDLVASQVQDIDNLDDDQKWAKFEAWGVQGLDKESLGSRGQGKLLFIYASLDKMIAYDSLREDGTYRYGVTRLEKTKFPVGRWYEQEARRKIKEQMSLAPLKVGGTRIIIRNLDPKIVEEIQSGAFLKAISDIWWPNILKWGARIFVNMPGKEHQARAPEMYEELCRKPWPQDTEERKFWHKENIGVRIGKSEDYTIKKIYFGYDANTELPEIEQGISCFRSGMKVDNDIKPSKNIRGAVYGYVEFDQSLDQELKQIEMPSHYGFRPEPIWKAIKKEIESQLESYEIEKLGSAPDPRRKKREKQTKDEKAALAFINNLTKDWGLTSRSSRKGGGVTKEPGPPPAPPKGIRIHLRDFHFPNPGSPRLDYGESVNDFYVEIVNDTPQRFTAKINVRVMKNRFITSLIDDSKRNKYILKPRSGAQTHTLSLEITDDIFQERGEYQLLIELTEHETGISKDTLVRKFWVNQEPPIKDNSLFDMRPIELRDDDRQWLIRHNDRDNKIVVEYNTAHPSYQRTLLYRKITGLISKKRQSPTERYLKEIALLVAIQLKLRNIVINGIKYKEEQFQPLAPDFLNQDAEQQFKAINNLLGTIRKDLDE